jgi:hypothetical protein
VFVGDRTSRLRRATVAGKGIRTIRSGDRTFVYSIAKGRVRAIAVTTTDFARSRKALRGAVSRVLRGRASAAPRTFVAANKAQASGKMLGRALAQTGNRETDARNALFCALNL